MRPTTLAAVCLLLAGVPSGPLRSETAVRIGVVAYEDFHSAAAQLDQLLERLSREAPELEFRAAVGVYGDVVSWLERREVDVALLTPGAFASLGRESFRYLATLQLPPATAPFASAGRRQPRGHDEYQSVCLVSQASSIGSLDQLRAAALEDRVEFVFVHPLSMSGRLAPLEALRLSGVMARPSRVRFSYSHTESMRLLLEKRRSGDGDDRERVAFVWDDAAESSPELRSAVRAVSIPALDKLWIPHDVVVCVPEFPAADRLRELLLSANRSLPYKFADVPDWRERFDVVRRWLPADSAGAARRTSLDAIGRLLLQHERSQVHPPRVALVLSGGGAKCSYQVGAVEAIESHLSALRAANPDARGLDIALVVGTSGGAINSLPIALGVTRTEAGRAAFQETWRSLDQRRIVRPSWSVRVNMGLWFAALQVAAILAVVQWRVSAERRGRVFVWIVTLSAAIQVACGYIPAAPWRWLGENHLWHHVWLWASFGVRGAAWSLLALGAAALLGARLSARSNWQLSIPRWLRVRALLVCILGLPLLQGVNLLVWEETLSGGEGMEAVIAKKMPRLINQYLTSGGQPPLELDASSTPAEGLRSVSRQILERQLLNRDLVITGSCLSQTSQDLPSDLYFFASPPSGAAPSYGARGIALAQQPAALLDVILGSGSIFPVFPPRVIDDIPRPGERLELVDGGFAHNSPLEAAVSWGATHVLLLEATPRQDSPRGSFLGNLVSSFRHLHQQAQLLDARSRNKAIVFSLAPTPPHLCVLDFADNLIDASIRRGREDAAESGFYREEGAPIFREAPRRVREAPASQSEGSGVGGT